MESWERFFESQAYCTPCKQIDDFPLYETDQFELFRCIPFTKDMYGKIISELHNGNLRLPKEDSRYSKLFPNARLSYWSQNKNTSIKECCKHSKNNPDVIGIIVFEAYDDNSSFVPTIIDKTPLRIIDGRYGQIANIINNYENSKEIKNNDILFMQNILSYRPDAIVYKSVIDPNIENFIFFEKGFKKLSLKSVKLRLNNNREQIIHCTNHSCDCVPNLESYGYSFEPIAKKVFHPEYKNTMEYKNRKIISQNN